MMNLRLPPVPATLLLVSLLLPGCGRSDSANGPHTGATTAEDVRRAQERDRAAALPPAGMQSEPLTSAEGAPVEIDGQPVQRFFLSNENGLKVTLMNYGAAVTSVDVPDRNGEFANITLGFDDFAGWQKNAPYMGVTIGRFAGRIGGGKFTLDGTDYTLAKNNGENHLHGGERGFSHRAWHAEEIEGGRGVRFTCSSPDGEEGYPGQVTATVVYTLTDDDELKIEYTATTDKPTPVNLTNHCYWNLSGTGTILDHVLLLNASRYLPLDEALIPTGKIAPVEETPMDFTTPTKIGARIDAVKGDNPVGGYDFCYVVDGESGELRLAARVADPQSGRVMEVFTTEPGLQFYTGNFLDGSSDSGGHQQHAGFCLEAQHFPDAPNRQEFPSTILKPGEVYTQTTVHKFSVAK